MKGYYSLFLFLCLIACSKEPKKEIDWRFENYKLTSNVNDYASLFSTKEKQKLSNKIDTINQEVNLQVFVMTIPFLPDTLTIKEFAVGLGNYYGMGSENENNGVHLCISMQDKSVFIATGDGIINRLTDGECEKIIDDIILKNFRNQYFYEGTSEALIEISILAKQ